MPKVYRAGDYRGTRYFNTRREAWSYRPGGGPELPESVERFDAADECNRLFCEMEDSERLFNTVRMILIDMLDVCPDGNTADRAAKFLEKYPLPPATSADRDGERSYGLG